MNCNTTHYRANSSSVPGDPTSETEKLSRLRAKTDRQIADVIHTRLATALRFAEAAAAEFAAGARVSAQQSVGHADRVLNEAQTLLLVLDDQHRRGLERKFRQVTETLDRACGEGDLAPPLFFAARSAC